VVPELLSAVADTVGLSPKPETIICKAARMFLHFSMVARKWIMITCSNSSEEKRSPQSIARCSTAHRGDLRAAPRANRPRSIAQVIGDRRPGFGIVSAIAPHYTSNPHKPS
jgi:hypothetical protein